MVTAIIGGVILTVFSIMFYLEDRDGGGLYDPDPSASYRYRQQHKKR
jgi:hypothetical protein